MLIAVEGGKGAFYGKRSRNGIGSVFHPRTYYLSILPTFKLTIEPRHLELLVFGVFSLFGGWNKGSWSVCLVPINDRLDKRVVKYLPNRDLPLFLHQIVGGSIFAVVKGGGSTSARGA